MCLLVCVSVCTWVHVHGLQLYTTFPVYKALKALYNTRHIYAYRILINTTQPCILLLKRQWSYWSSSLVLSLHHTGWAADGGYKISTASLPVVLLFTSDVQTSCQCPGRFSQVKPRLNWINPHVHMIRPYPVDNYLKHLGVHGVHEWQGDKGTLIKSSGGVLHSCGYVNSLVPASQISVSSALCWNAFCFSHLQRAFSPSFYI